MITRRQYKIYRKEGPIRTAYDYTDTYLLGLRIKRTIIETSRRGVAISPDLRFIACDGLIPFMRHLIRVVPCRHGARKSHQAHGTLSGSPTFAKTTERRAANTSPCIP